MVINTITLTPSVNLLIFTPASLKGQLFVLNKYMLVRENNILVLQCWMSPGAETFCSTGNNCFLSDRKFLIHIQMEAGTFKVMSFIPLLFVFFKFPLAKLKLKCPECHADFCSSCLNFLKLTLKLHKKMSVMLDRVRIWSVLYSRQEHCIDQWWKWFRTKTSAGAISITLITRVHFILIQLSFIYIVPLTADSFTEGKTLDVNINK